MSSEEQIGITRTRQRTRTIDVTGGDGQITVSRAAYGREVEEPTKTVRVPVFSTEPARVRVEGSVTKNLGDYNSARVAVCIELPCYPEDSEIRRAYNYASQLLDELLPEQLEHAING